MSKRKQTENVPFKMNETKATHMEMRTVIKIRRTDLIVLRLIVCLLGKTCVTINNSTKPFSTQCEHIAQLIAVASLSTFLALNKIDALAIQLSVWLMCNE